MSITVKTVLILISLGLFALAAFSVPTGRLGAVAADLFCWEPSTLA